MGLKTYLAISILIISALLYKFLTCELVEVEFEPVIVKAPIEKVFECYKNKFLHERLWRSFDMEGSIKSVKVDKKLSTANKLIFLLEKQYKLLKYFQIKIHLDVEYKLNIERYTISSIAKSNLVNTYVEIGLKETSKGVTRIDFKETLEVPKLFSTISKNKALDVNTGSLNKIKQLLENNENYCIIE